MVLMSSGIINIIRQENDIHPVYSMAAQVIFAQPLNVNGHECRQKMSAIHMG
jgi:hypothetical protein